MRSLRTGLGCVQGSGPQHDRCIRTRLQYQSSSLRMNDILKNPVSRCLSVTMAGLALVTPTELTSFKLCEGTRVSGFTPAPEHCTVFNNRVTPDTTNNHAGPWPVFIVAGQPSIFRFLAGYSLVPFRSSGGGCRAFPRRQLVRSKLLERAIAECMCDSATFSNS